MKRIIQITTFTFLLLIVTDTVLAQDKVSNDVDIQLKETLYKKYKRQAQAYDKKEFDALFFEFFQKEKDHTITLTKEEFYTYTIKIAAYSEKLGMLYKEQKAAATQTKEEWFNKSYADYLKSKT